MTTAAGPKPLGPVNLHMRSQAKSKPVREEEESSENEEVSNEDDSEEESDEGDDASDESDEVCVRPSSR